jgi:hypothetical protein
VSSRTRIAPLEVRQDVLRKRCIEVRSDPDLPPVQIERVRHRAWLVDRNQTGERLAGLGDDDLVPLGDPGQEAREVGLGLASGLSTARSRVDLTTDAPILE